MPENLHNLLKIRIFDTLKAFSVQRSAFSVQRSAFSVQRSAQIKYLVLTYHQNSTGGALWRFLWRFFMPIFTAFWQYKTSKKLLRYEPNKI